MKYFIFAILTLVFPLAAEPESSEMGTEQEMHGLTTEQIEERKKHMDESYQRLSAKIESDFQERQEFQKQIKDDRLTFERERLNARKAFLDSLKGLKPEDRSEAMKDFNEKEREARKKFQETQRAKHEEFRKTHKEERMEMRKNIKVERKEMKDKKRR